MVRVVRRFIFQSHGGKQTIENVQMFQLGNKLARLLNNKEYSKKANTVWKWINNVHIINMTTYQVRASQLHQLLTRKPHPKVYDGINMKTCKSGPGITFTYTAGTVIGGLVEIFKLEKSKEHLDLANNLTLSVFK